MLLQLTVTSVISIVLFSLFFAILLEIVLRSDMLISRVRCELLLLCMVLPVIRIVMPVEILPWTKSIAVPYVFPSVVQNLNKGILVIAGSGITLWNLIQAVIVLGAVILTISVILEYQRFERFVNMLPDVDDSRVYDVVEQILKEKDKKRKIVLKWCKADEEPCVGGFLQPYILLPKRAFSKKELDCILRHEVAHCVQGDLFIRLIWISIKIIYWWNPVVKILDRQFEQLLEIRADDNAVNSAKNDISCDYMEVLVHLDQGTNMGSNRKFCASFRAWAGLATSKRVRRLLARGNLSKISIVACNLFCVVCILVLTVAMNVVILEPKGEIPDVESTGGQILTDINSFFIQNEDGTYDLYFDGVHCATLENTMGTNYPIYETLEEAMKYEELK